MSGFYFSNLNILSYEASLEIKNYVANQDFVDLVIIAYTANQGEEEIKKCLDHS